MEYTTKQVLIGLYLYNDFDWDKAYKQMRNKELLDEDWMNEHLKQIDQLGNCFITIVDKEYPSCLKELRKPPIILQKDLAETFSEVKRLVFIYKDEDMDIY